MSIKNHMTVAAAAAAATLGAAAQTDAAEWEISIGGYYHATAGYADSTSGTDFDGRTGLVDEEVVFRHRLTADNGLTFSTDINLDDATGQQIDESFIFISGDFGRLVFNGSEYPPGVDPDISLCGGGGPKRGYFTPRFAGFQSDVSFVEGEDQFRASLATEIGGLLINPAISYGYDLSGEEVSAAGTACFDTKNLFPTFWSFGFDHANLDGGARVDNQNFPSGIGLVGVGGQPGAYVRTPTDIQFGSFDVERTTTSFTTRLDHPLLVGGIGTSSSSPALISINAIAGLKGGQIDQTETVRTTLNSPAFGANSLWSIDYDTGFNGNFAGGFGGISVNVERPIGENSSITFTATGTVGLYGYKFDVRDSVRGTGLGGALNYANTRDYSFSDTVVTGGIGGSVGYKHNNWTFTVNGGVDWNNNPAINYQRPDSNAAGALDPTFSLTGNTDVHIGGGIRLTF